MFHIYQSFRLIVLVISTCFKWLPVSLHLEEFPSPLPVLEPKLISPKLCHLPKLSPFQDKE